MYVDKVATLATPSPIFSGGVQTSPQNVPQNNLQNVAATATQGLSMKNWIWALAFLIIGAAALGQTSNTLYARNFPGSTVGQKVAAAQADCGTNASIPCVIVIDSSLAAYPSGTMPAKCSGCVWEDYRTAGGFALPLGGGTLTGPLVAPSINNVINAEQEPGSDICAKINAALSQISAQGGVIDARGFTGDQVTSTTCGASYPLAQGTPVMILFNPASPLVPATTTTTVIEIAAGMIVSGLHVDASGVSGYSADAVSFPYNYGSTTGFTSLENFVLKGTPGQGNALHIAPPTGGGTAFLNVHDGAITGFDSGIFLDASAAWINGNTFSGVSDNSSYYCLNLTGTSSTNVVEANQFSNINCEGNYSTAYSITALSLTYAYQNTFTNLNAWDYTGTGQSTVTLGADVASNWWLSGFGSSSLTSASAYNNPIQGTTGSFSGNVSIGGSTTATKVIAQAGSTLTLVPSSTGSFTLLVTNAAQSANYLIMDNSGDLTLNDGWLTVNSYVAAAGYIGTQNVTFTPSSGWGTSATASCVSGYHCDQLSGMVEVVAGTGASVSSPLMVTFTWAKALPHDAVCTVSNVYWAGSLLAGPEFVEGTTTSAEIAFADITTAPSSGAESFVTYVCGE